MTRRVLVIGEGRAGGAFALALGGAGWEVVLVAGRSAPVPTSGADLVLICVADPFVADVSASLGRTDAVVAHCAGALGLDVLSGHDRVAAIHPLVSLPNAEVGARRLRDHAWFATAGDPIVDEVVAALGGRSFVIADEHRAAYHAAACIAANHLVALLGQVERVAGAAGAPFEAYLDLARGAVENVAELGPASALTGPAARGDEATIARHLAALDPSERPAYEAMAAEARRLATTGASWMETITTIAELRRALGPTRATGSTVGFVPTMGYLHDGHESLMDRARAECDAVVASIFVNPLQFGVGEDLDAYPRDLDGDGERAARAGVDLLFVPTVAEMYPEPVATTVSVAGVSAPLEGASRPTHFDGVATVVAKLFNIVGPCRAYFGEKDFQQLAVIRRMVADLSVPVDVIACPTLREPDGLARSSRNVYLSAEEREIAPVLHRALTLGASMIAAGETDADVVRRAMAAEIDAAPLGRLDYVEVADAATLETQTVCGPSSRLLGAVRFGRARLIDNVGVGNVSAPPSGAARDPRGASDA